MARQGTFKATPKSLKRLRLSQCPLKDDLKKKFTEAHTPSKQDVTNCARRERDLPAGPIYCSFPDFKSVVLKERKLDFSRREVTSKPHL